MNATFCYVKILEGKHHKTVAVWLLTSHLTNPLNNASSTCWARQEEDKYISDGLLWIYHG